MSDATGGSFMVTLDLTSSGGSRQTSGEIAYNADATGGRASVHGILEVELLPRLQRSSENAIGKNMRQYLVQLVSRRFAAGTSRPSITQLDRVAKTSAQISNDT